MQDKIFFNLEKFKNSSDGIPKHKDKVTKIEHFKIKNFCSCRCWCKNGNEPKTGKTTVTYTWQRNRMWKIHRPVMRRNPSAG